MGMRVWMGCSAGMFDCDSVVADDEMSVQDVKNDLDGLGAGVVLAETVDESDRDQRSSTAGGVGAG